MATSFKPKTVVGSLRALLEGLIDYAGLFPPAAVDMQTAVDNYARYLSGPHRFALGRFIAPASRLEEFASTFSSVHTNEKWHLSAIIGADHAEEFGRVQAFNTELQGRALVDVVEVKASSVEEVRKIVLKVPDGVMPYFEILADSPADLFTSIVSVGGRAKIRTGGLVETAFPQAVAIAQFIIRAADARCAFKATAGLHHPVRCIRPLTYAPDAPQGKMHGFLNVFLAACAYGGLGEQVNRQFREQVKTAILAFLMNEVPTNFSFTDDKVTARGLLTETSDGVTRNSNYELSVTTEVIRHARENFAIAFGSCSFEEPIEDLQNLQLL